MRENIVPSCDRCNSSKSDSDMEEWYVKQEFYMMIGRRELICG